MNTIDFCYWLQGYFEISDSDELSAQQVKIIKNHLHLVFKHEIDPLRESQTTATVEELNNAHSGFSTQDYNPLNDDRVRC